VAKKTQELGDHVPRWAAAPQKKNTNPNKLHNKYMEHSLKT